ncbi:hypothetical protein L596_016894 [Steinernema carpocapsae]|uniref:Uncharacterized protein n=1 Tax=Steinernema carpocapsae TaxID=34508 RepID=A0A4U5NKY4_STECR|nr:hypothetical protein L596_016894 [Steinernema carpocapsae]
MFLLFTWGLGVVERWLVADTVVEARVKAAYSICINATLIKALTWLLASTWLHCSRCQCLGSFERLSRWRKSWGNVRMNASSGTVHKRRIADSQSIAC